LVRQTRAGIREIGRDVATFIFRGSKYPSYALDTAEFGIILAKDQVILRSYRTLDLERLTMVLGITRRESTPERWQAALARARKEGVEVRQLVGSGGWIATSGTNTRAAYELEVTGGIVHGCACPAALHDDPVCKHRAAYWLVMGIVDPSQVEAVQPIAA
jgi:hypothetical protein